MNRREANAALLAGAVLAALPAAARAEQIRSLGPARRDGGMPLMNALLLRRSSRAFADRPLPPQLLADLLWAAYGVNRAGGERTAPCWRHIVAIDVYAAMADGLWLYAPGEHALRLRSKQDLRALSGTQDFAATAPLDLIYVAHGERMDGLAPEERRLYASVDTAFIGQNVYLYCAATGLATVFRAAIDHARLKRALQLGDGQFVTFAQTVGFPAS